MLLAGMFPQLEFHVLQNLLVCDAGAILALWPMKGAPSGWMEDRMEEVPPAGRGLPAECMQDSQLQG